MNYLPFCGYWFYGGATSTETAAFFSSFGLLSEAPSSVLRLLMLMGVGI